MSQLHLLQKSVKLTTLLQSFHSFSSCISDLSWLFSQSLHIIQQFSRQSLDYYRDRKSKRMRIDNIEKEYLTLKLRFDQLDIRQIQGFIQRLVREQQGRRKESWSLEETVQSRRDTMKQNTWKRDGESKQEKYQSSTFRNHQTLRNSRVNTNMNTNSNVEITQRQTLGKKEIELNQKLYQLNEQIRHSNFQITRIKDQNTQFRDQIEEMKKHIVLLTDIVHSKRLNELNVIQKTKGIVRVFKQKGVSVPQLDRMLYGLVEFEQRLKQNANEILGNQYYNEVQYEQSKRNHLMLQINTMMRQIEDLKQEKGMVEEQIEQLGELYQQRRVEGRSENRGNVLGWEKEGNGGEYQMMLLQAVAIERLMGS